MEPARKRALQERYDVANKEVTLLLEKVDGNVCRATESAVQMMTHVQTFVAHTRAVHSAVSMWASFFKAFEDQEQKQQLMVCRALDVRDKTAPNVVSPRTPSLDDSSCCAGAKRPHNTPEHTPDFGASPPRSVRVKTGCDGVPGTGSCASRNFSPLRQPNLSLDVGKDRDTHQASASGANVLHSHGAGETNSCVDTSYGSDGKTPTLSSPTITIHVSEVESLRACLSEPASTSRCFVSAHSKNTVITGPLSEATLKSLPPIFRSGQGAEQVRNLCLQSDAPTQQTLFLVAGVKFRSGRHLFSSQSDLCVLACIGPCLHQIQAVYKAVMQQDDRGISMLQVAAELSYDLPRIRFLLDTLVAKKLLRIVDSTFSLVGRGEAFENGLSSPVYRVARTSSTCLLKENTAPG